MMKQVSGFCGTGVKMKLWNFRVKDECPLCTEPEDNYQVLRFSSTAASDRWDETINSLEVTLADSHTPREAINMITGQLHNWWNTSTSLPQYTTTSLYTSFLVQTYQYYSPKKKLARFSRKLSQCFATTG